MKLSATTLIGYGVCSLISLFIFLIDILFLLPPYSISFLYPFVILSTIIIKKEHSTYIFEAICAALVMLEIILLFETPTLIALSNAGISLLLIVTITLFVLKMKEIRRELSNANEHFVNILNVCPQALLMVDGRGKVVFSNQVAQETLECDGKKLYHEVLAKVLPEMSTRFNAARFSRKVKPDEVHIFNKSLETFALTKKSGEIPIELKESYFKVNDEYYYLYSFVNITDRKKREKSIAKLVEELQRSNQELDDFAYIASHDLKEPLRGIHNYCTILMEKIEHKIDEDSRAKLAKLPVLTQKLESLIDSLLRYSRLGKKNLDIKSVDMNNIVQEILQTMKYSLEQKNVHIQLDTLLPIVFGDQVRLFELMTNLISNAIKYNESLQPSIHIGVLENTTLIPQSITINPHDIVMYVKDNGIGIKEEQIPKIFKIFKRLHTQDKYGGGTGVGMTIVKKIIDLHQGKIWVESTVGQGTTFYFSLPGEVVWSNRQNRTQFYS